MDSAEGVPSAMPSNKEAEMGVLGAMILDNSIIPKALARLSPQSFWYTPHKIIYQGIVDAYDKHKAVDLIILREFIGDKLREHGGMAYAATVVDDTPSTDHGIAYAESVATTFRMREAIEAGEKIVHKAREGATIEEIYEIADHIKSRCNPSTYMTWEKCLRESLQAIDSMANEGVMWTTGWSNLDNALGGLRKKLLYVVGGKTSQGKTSVCVNLAKSNLELGNARILYNGFENIDQFTVRLAAIDSNVPLRCFLKPSLCTPEELEKVKSALHALDRWKDNIVVLNSQSVNQMKAVCDDFKPDIVFLDYMGRYVNKFSGGESNRHIAHSRLVSDLQDLAIDKNAAVFAFSQLGRRQEDQRNRKPSINDLKESGDIENTADVVMLLWWAWRDNMDPRLNPEDYDIILAKNKLGECGSHHLRLSVETLKLGEWGRC